MTSHRQVLSKQIILHCHTISYHCASIIADCSNTGQRKNHVSYLLSSLQRQHHHSTSLTTTDPSLHDGLSRLLALADHVEIVKTAGASGHLAQKSFLRSFGSAAGSSAAAEASAAGAAALRRRPARPARTARTGSLPIRRPQTEAPPANQLQWEGVQNRKRDDWNECFD
jgi:hypothetical protein